VVILDTLETGRKENLADVPHRLVTGSILDEGLLAEAFEGCQGLVHLAALVSVPASLADPEKARATNDEGTRLALEAAWKAGITRAVQASTSAVYGPRPQLPSREDGPVEPASPYASSKLAAEGHGLAIRKGKGLSCCSLRLFNVYGRGQDPTSPYSGVISILLDRAERGVPFTIYGDGGQMRDFIHVSEAAEAIERGLEAADPPPVVNIATGTSITLLELVEAVEAAYGRKVETVFEPERKGDVRLSQADVSLADSALGFRSRIRIEEGVRMTLGSSPLV
jgi:UDP-glucose 4-epimerase